MKKLLFVLTIFVTFISYGQAPGTIKLGRARVYTLINYNSHKGFSGVTGKDSLSIPDLMWIDSTLRKAIADSLHSAYFFRYSSNRASTYTGRTVPDRNYVDSALSHLRDSLAALIGGGSSFYQTVQSNTTSQTQRAKLNFGTQFSVADNSGNGSTDVTIGTLNQNTTGTAANLSGTPALPNGTTVTTQSPSDNSTKAASTAYADAAISALSLASGQWTPTITNGSNVSSNTNLPCEYIRVGNTVSFSGHANIIATAGSVSTTIELTLPISSSLSSVNDGNGTVTVSGGGITSGGQIVANTSTHRIILSFINGSTTGALTLAFSGHYTID